MRQFRTVVFVFLVTSVLILSPAATKYSTADPLPKGLPSWFRELDRDKDGQVSLREWVRGGRSRDEFRLYDLNGDGFITPDEVLRAIRKVQPLKMERGQVFYDGAIEEGTDELYQGKRTYKIFTVRLEEGKIYQIEEISPVFYSYLYLEDPSGAIVEQHNSGGRGLTARLIHQAAETGTYRVIATSQDGVKTGDFSLSIRLLHEVPKELPRIRIARDNHNILPKGLPPWFKELDEDEDGQVSLQEWLAGDGDLDEFLFYDRNGDGFITPDEVLRIVRNAQRLRLNKGRLDLQDAIEEPTEERYQNKKAFKIFTIKLEEGKTYQIEQVSPVFFSYLYLEDPSGTIVDEQSSTGRDQTARLLYEAAETGVYRLIVTSQGGVRTGDFSLSIRVVPDKDGSPPPPSLPSWFKELDEDEDGQVSLQEWLAGGGNQEEFLHYDLNGDGFITAAEVLRVVKKVQPLKLERGQLDYQGTIEEPTDERYQGKKAFKILLIKLEEGKTYLIEQVSQVYYSYLYLEDPSGAIVDEHNSGGRGETARLLHQAEDTGLYRIIATSQDGVKIGAFSLSIRIVHEWDRSLQLRKLPSWFKELDKDHDGQVSLQEWIRGGRNRDEFLLYDLNGDGFLTPPEVRRYLESHPDGQKKENAKPGSKLPEGFPRWFKELDKDHDGQVSLQEWIRGGRDRDEFRLYDLNGDGFITVDEVRRYLQNRANSEKKEKAKREKRPG